MIPNIADLESKLLKAKIELMTRSVFISTIALSVRHVITATVETAATNNKSVFYNPEFIQNLSIGQLAGLVAHECWHIAFLHLVRRGMRDPLIWNVAGDIVINNMLLAAAFELPPNGWVESRYSEWTTDAIYDDLIKEQVKPDPGTMMLDIQGDCGGDDGQDTGEAEDAKATVTDILVRAHTQARAAGETAGSVPGEVLRVIDELINPKIPWPVVLNRFLDQRVKEEYLWTRRNRRFVPYMPSMHSLGLGHLVWGIDTSGSQDDEDLRGTLSEIVGVQKTFNPEHMTIIDCDSRIHEIYEVDANTDIMSLKFHGGGGTRFGPVLDYVAAHPAQALIYFTDLHGDLSMNPVDYPILWICNSRHAPAPFGETVYYD